MNIIEAMKSFINSCSFISEFSSGVKIDYTSNKPVNFGLSSSGNDVVKIYLSGNTVNQHSFVLYASKYTIEDADRLTNSGFLEKLSDWIAEKNKARAFPMIEKGHIQKITAANAILFDLAENGDTGLYQIQIQVIYYKET